MEFAFVLLVLAGGFWYWSGHEARKFAEVQDQERLLRIQKYVGCLASAHSEALLRKRKRLLQEDDYGKLVFGPWGRELAYFIEHVVLAKAEANNFWPRGLDRGSPEWIYCEGIIDLKLDAFEEVEPTLDLSDVSDGLTYEIFCKKSLEAHGWLVRTTPTSGDQGADLVAQKDNLRVVIQCKFYSSPVGNKAVQEAHTAKAIHGATHSAVVTNSTYTKAARELAFANDVLLIHHEQLDKLDEL